MFDPTTTSLIREILSSTYGEHLYKNIVPPIELVKFKLAQVHFRARGFAVINVTSCVRKVQIESIKWANNTALKFKDLQYLSPSDQ